MSDFPLSNKVTKKKFALLETRFEGEGGVPSSFTPPRSKITFSPSPGDNVSRLAYVHSNMTFDASGQGNQEGEASQSSCKTLKCGNVAPVAAVSVVTKGKKKSTPNKRPASAISLSINVTNNNSAKKESDKKRAKSPKLTEHLESRDIVGPSSASRDTLLDYGYFSSASNPSKANGSGSRLSTTSPAVPKAAGSSRIAAAAASSPVPTKQSTNVKPNGQKKLDGYFGLMKANNDVSKEKSTKSEQKSNSISNDGAVPKPNTTPDHSSTTISSESTQHLHDKIASLEKQLAEATSQNLAIKNNQTMLTLQLQATVKRQSMELQQVKSDSKSRHNKSMDVIEKLITDESLRKSAELRQQLASDGARLGRLVTARSRGRIQRAIETWEDGEEPTKLKRRREELKRRREVLEKRWGDLARYDGATSISEAFDGETSNSERPMDDLEKFEAQETIRMHLEELKREERKLDEEDRALTIEKRKHIRTLKLVANEDASKFRFRHKLHDRYVPLNILGKGGFSEVWQAYDLQDLRHVAVKIHQLESSWSDAKKENYTKHVSREYEIHREVRHPRIVSLYDVFEIDTDSFATVLECCEGEDLDTILKDRGRLGERDARAILLQVLSGMRYLSTPSEDGRRQGIIHYDLKPGNILFDGDGRAKITDFGLSKIVSDELIDEGMELTSQGAGTYWYLPPECFLMDQDVRISNKVDVWSIGVIYFQMLFGRRPFGDGESQDKVLRNQTMLNATEVNFPSKPMISEGAKDFIRT
ncbi:hypothetical protein ACHAWO_004956 [Cyclotella atomus]|uniref:Protein kinase domain-containing protein n=1 Tax=Cyclotella atomus TaxID=382360 RepID=A0ABD3MU71_9STRA